MTFTERADALIEAHAKQHDLGPVEEFEALSESCVTYTFASVSITITLRPNGTLALKTHAN